VIAQSGATLVADFHAAALIGATLAMSSSVVAFATQTTRTSSASKRSAPT